MNNKLLDYLCKYAILEISKEMKISEQEFIDKANGMSQFTVGEMQFLKKKLNIANPLEIFFTLSVP